MKRARKSRCFDIRQFLIESEDDQSVEEKEEFNETAIINPVCATGSQGKNKIKFTISWHWAMPNSQTFQIAPILTLLNSFIPETLDSSSSIRWCDPFCRNSIVKKRMWKTNDLSSDFEADCHMDAGLFLESLEKDSCDGVLFDPPYSVHQTNQMYNSVGGPKLRKQAAFCYDQIARILKPGGVCISFGWNSNGAGMKRGFEKQQLMIIAHGGSHNDTIVVVERKGNVLQK